MKATNNLNSINRFIKKVKNDEVIKINVMNGKCYLSVIKPHGRLVDFLIALDDVESAIREMIAEAGKIVLK